MSEKINIVCKKCGYGESKVRISKNIEEGICVSCGSLTYYKVLENNTPRINLVHCPYCNSIDVKKISTASKVGSVALWGVFAVGKVSKQWHCNNCKSDF